MAQRVHEQAPLPATILDGLADGVLGIDARWCIRYANRGAERVFEQARAELVGGQLWRVLPELGATAIGGGCRKAMADRSNESVEAQYGAFGSWLEARIFPASDDGLVVIFRDITDRVVAERAHAETRALLDAVMHFSTSLIYAKDPDGRFTLVNRRLEELLGFASGSLVGKSDHDIFPPEIADPFRENDRFVFRERRPLTIEEEILVDGRLRTNLSVKFPLERPDGTVFGTAGVSTDITDRVRHQQEMALLAEVGLKMSETLDWDASLSAIVDVVAEQFADYCLLDLLAEDGVMRRQAVAARDRSRLPKLREAMAYSPDLSVDNPLTRAVRSGKTERVVDSDVAWRDSIARSPEHRAIIEAVNPRSVLLVPLVARGRTLGLLEIISGSRRFDERDQETAEELGRLCGLALDNRRATEQLRQEGSLRELFMAVLAHDLRTPLNSITLGGAALAGRQDQPDATSRVARRIVSSAQRMEKLIEQVLDLTRARAMGGIPVERRPIQLTPVVEAVVEEVRTAHPGREIEVVTHGDCSGTWDPDRLAQVVSNLVGNAVTHGTIGTPVRVELVGGENVVLTVHNASTPIPPETLATLFDPFRRGEKSSQVARRGLGLGLYITDQIVRAHGGSIVAESDTSGTRFRVTLPR
ncbi:MAG: PAS domain-containing protein [Myxococcota bacterium]